MAIAVKLDDLLHDAPDDPDRARRAGRHHPRQPVDPQDRQGPRDPLLDARGDLRRRSTASPATCSNSRPTQAAAEQPRAGLRSEPQHERAPCGSILPAALSPCPPVRSRSPRARAAGCTPGRRPGSSPRCSSSASPPRSSSRSGMPTRDRRSAASSSAISSSPPGSTARRRDGTTGKFEIVACAWPRSGRPR